MGAPAARIPDQKTAGRRLLLAPRDRGALGSVEGRAFAEAQRGGAEPTPYASVSVLLLPRSPEFESELEGIKARFRDSPDTYLEAEPKLSAARLSFERALIEALKFSTKIGRGTALKAVRTAIQNGQTNMIKLRQMARKLRLEDVLARFLEDL